MKTRELANLDIPKGKAMRAFKQACGKAADWGLSGRDIRDTVRAILQSPEKHRNDKIFGEAVASLLSVRKARARFDEREDPAPYTSWGIDLDKGSVDQMDNACRLPIAAAGALMPDAHLGYGLPIGGVLATYNSVIPYAVGVDIACRMKLTVLDLPVEAIDNKEDRLIQAIEQETRFGIGSIFKQKRSHDVMDEDWRISKITKDLKDRAWSQLGTSGSGNHFVEYGTLRLDENVCGLEPGTYLALLSHSGSRGAGANIAGYYSRLAMEKHPELPRELQHLAWLDLNSGEGLEYWDAMQLMGLYAAANHELIHKHIAQNLGAEVLLDIENHHNFAWEENHNGKNVIVHRKGATPAGEGVLGIIPGSMGAPGYVVRGKGNEKSLLSASHGAGRRMSRTQAKKEFNWRDVKKYLADRRVKLISAGLDEVPMAYKNIDHVMAAQTDLVETIAKFDPRIVKMAPAGERPED